MKTDTMSDEPIEQGYKRTEVGVIPADWDLRPLGEIGTFSKGRGISKRDLVEDGLPCIRYGEIYTHHHDVVREFYSFITPEVALGSQRLHKGDLLFTGSGETAEEIGKCVAFLGEVEVYAGGDIVILSPAEHNSMYLGYLMNHAVIVNQKMAMAQGHTVVHIHATHLQNLQIPLPSPSEQRSIADVLSDVDALLDGLDRLIAKKRAIKQGAMQALLTGRVRLPGFARKLGYKRTEVGLVPEDWEVKHLGEIADVDPENLSANSDPDYSFSYISLEDVERGTLRGYSEQVFRTAPSRARRVIRKGDILVSTVRPNLKSHLYVKQEVRDTICSTGFSVLRCKSYVADPALVFFHLFVGIIEKQIESLLTGSNYPAINSNDVKALQIPFPTDGNEQIAIAEVLSDMDAEIDILDKRRAKLRDLKQGMMQELLTGRIRLVQPHAQAQEAHV